MIPYGKQDISSKDIEAVIEVLKSDFITQGPIIPSFEKSLAEVVGAKFGVVVNSATSALHLACLSLGLKEGDFLWTSPISFVASANCGLYCGASIDFVDIDRNTYTLCPDALRTKLEKAEIENKLPKVVIPVHFAGMPCKMREIHALSKKYGFKVIEDASHAIGASIENELIGSCEYSDITVFSFHPVKIITTGEGGGITTNDNKLYEKLILLRSHGVTRDADKMAEKKPTKWYYEQIELGFNYRMTDLQAALGLSQLSRLEEFILKRNNLANHYDKLLNDTDFVLPSKKKKTFSAYHLYPIQLKKNMDRTEVFDFMRANGVGVNVHYIPIHLQPFYKKKGFKHGDYPVAEEYYSRALSLPIFPALEEQNQDKIIELLSKA